MASDASAASSGAEAAGWARRARVLFDRGLGIVLIGYGLSYWATVIGVAQGSDAIPFDQLSGPFQWATFNFAVAYPVAGVGLWMLVPWGTVVWLYAAAVALAMSTVFANTFGFDAFAIALHLVALAGFVALHLASRQRRPGGLGLSPGAAAGSGERTVAGAERREGADRAVQVKPGAET